MWRVPRRVPGHTIRTPRTVPTKADQQTSQKKRKEKWKALASLQGYAVGMPQK